MKLHEIPKDIRWGRRLITTPLWFLLAILMPVLTIVSLPLLVLYDLIKRSDLSATRTAIYFSYFFLNESSGLVIALGIWLRYKLGLLKENEYELANRRLQRRWSRGLFWSTNRIFSLKVSIDGLEALEDPRPCVVMSRHASTLDTMLPLAVVRELKWFRYVIKSELLIDPALDYVAQRFPNVFVNRGGSDPEFEIQKVLALGTELEENGAVVVYPEGTRFSKEKRARLLEKFSHDPVLKAVTESLRYTLPPLREGSVRLISSTPNADLVFIAHRGVDKIRAMSDLISGGMTNAHLEVLIWRYKAEDVPREPDAVRDFMVKNWQRIDAFVAQGESIELSVEGR